MTRIVGILDTVTSQQWLVTNKQENFRRPIGGLLVSWLNSSLTPCHPPLATKSISWMQNYKLSLKSNTGHLVCPCLSLSIFVLQFVVCLAVTPPGLMTLNLEVFEQTWLATLNSASYSSFHPLPSHFTRDASSCQPPNWLGLLPHLHDVCHANEGETSC